MYIDRLFGTRLLGVPRCFLSERFLYTASNLTYNSNMTEEKNRKFPYRLREPFLSKTEAALFHLLTEVVGSRYVICPKVSLSDMFMIVRPNENVHFFNKIFRKHVDFLLCDPHTFAPSFGVEIVPANTKNGMREVDRFMEDLFNVAGIPLVRIPLNGKYGSSDIIGFFQVAVMKARKSSSVESPQDSVPNCPKCGKMMVLRVHRSGADAGMEYYGCIDSPKCSGIVPIG